MLEILREALRAIQKEPGPLKERRFMGSLELLWATSRIVDFEIIPDRTASY
jgi:hypothetical protein